MRIPKKAKIPIGVIWALLIGVVFAVSAMARTEGPPEFECDCSIEIVGTPELNRPFEAILTWTPRAKVNLSRDILDTVYFWRAYEHMRYVGGDTLWVGDLEKDKTYSMKASFEIFDYGYCMVVAKIISMRTKGIGAIVAGDVDIGLYAEKTCFSNRSKLENSNKDAHSENKSEIKWHYSANGDSIGIQSFSGKKLNFGLPPATVKAADNANAAKPAGEPLINKSDTNVIYVLQSDILTNRPIKISSLKTNKIILPENVEWIEIDTTCDLRFEKVEDNILIVDKPQNECYFTIIINDSTCLVPIKLLSYYSISGTASYVDNFTNINPCISVNVYLIECVDGNCNYQVLRDYDETGYDGYFFFSADFPVSIVAVSSSNEATSVMYAEDHYLSVGDNLYYYILGVQISNPSYQNVYLADNYLRATDLDISGAYNIANKILACSDYLWYDLQANDLPDKNITIWDVEDNSQNVSSFGSFFDNSGNPIIYINSINFINEFNWDEWDEDIIAHEYGHYVMYYNMESIPDAGGTWHFYYPRRDGRDLSRSLSEGWASLFQSLVWNDPIYIDSHIDSLFYYVLDYERPFPDAPYYRSTDNYETTPPRQSIQYEGAHVPGAVAIALWDLYDNIDDDNYYVGSTLWGHNNDYNGSTNWCGADAIWDVLTNYDPRPNDAEHNHCWNMYEFIHGWRTFGYPVNQTFINIFEAHGIPVFLPGDTNNDDEVNLLDILRLIRYLYDTPPEEILYPSSADASGDCTVNMLDILYLIAFVYEDGAEPLVGCVNLY
jgi:hypothetical protein